jgi:hypothetical protein
VETIDRVGNEQTRAWYPDSEGYVERDGVRTFYEVCGAGEPTVLLLPTWSIVHSQVWKMQIPVGCGTREAHGHGLDRHRAGRAMDFATDGPTEIAAAIAEEIGREVDYRPVDAGGAARAAASIGELL